MSKPTRFPAQSQKKPGYEYKMHPAPEVIRRDYLGSGKLTDKVALITGGDSGIGRSIGVHFAREGAELALTRALAKNLIKSGIRVNGVAPGPIWTPFIVSDSTPQEVARFGQEAPMGRAGQPSEVAPAYVFLASEDASYISGQVIHPNGGEVLNT